MPVVMPEKSVAEKQVVDLPNLQVYAQLDSNGGFLCSYRVVLCGKEIITRLVDLRLEEGFLPMYDLKLTEYSVGKFTKYGSRERSD